MRFVLILRQRMIRRKTFGECVDPRSNRSVHQLFSYLYSLIRGIRVIRG
jgi:hypothetical protein